jgi:hypothetical protein
MIIGTQTLTHYMILLQLQILQNNSKIFQPILDMSGLPHQVLSSAKDFISLFQSRVSWARTMIADPPKESDEEYAKLMYFEMIKSIVSGVVFGNSELSVQASTGHSNRPVSPFDLEKRKQGLDWTFLGDTMTGFARLDNVKNLLTDVFDKGIEGDYIGKILLFADCLHDCNV